MANGIDGGFSLPRIIEVLLAAGIVGGITLYANNAINGARIDEIERNVKSNEQTIKEVSRGVSTELSKVRELLSDMRVEFAKSNRLELEINNLRQQVLAEHENQDERIDKLEYHQNTIWPRLREMKERVQDLEPETAQRWQH